MAAAVRPMPPGRFGPLAAVVLDMDGTLLDTETAYRGAFVAAMAGCGGVVDAAFYATLIGVSSLDRGPLVAARFGADFPWGDCLRDYRARKARLLAGSLRAKPGAAGLLAGLAARGLPCAVATSAGRRTALAALDGAGLLAAVPMLVTRDEVSAGKPDPALFLRAAAALAVAPAGCLAVEDSPVGVTAARAAGMRVVAVPDAVPLGGLRAGPAVMVVADLWAVARLIVRLRNDEATAA